MPYAVLHIWLGVFVQFCYMATESTGKGLGHSKSPGKGSHHEHLQHSPQLPLGLLLSLTSAPHLPQTHNFGILPHRGEGERV